MVEEIQIDNAHFCVALLSRYLVISLSCYLAISLSCYLEANDIATIFFEWSQCYRTSSGVVHHANPCISAIKFCVPNTKERHGLNTCLITQQLAERGKETKRTLFNTYVHTYILTHSLTHFKETHCLKSILSSEHCSEQITLLSS